MMLSRLLLPTLIALCVTAAPAAEKKRSKRPPPVVSPIFHDNGSVTFQIQAPHAEKVLLNGEMIEGQVSLEKGENGIWSTTLEDLPTGLHSYNFSVDGLKMIDPGNSRNKPMRSPKTSLLHIPGDHLWDFTEVPHGTVHYHAYHSEPIDRFREIQVYTPPGYETAEEDYPLLVLQHGHSDTFATWVAFGKAHWILDNLIAAGEAQPMIVVMLDGHPIPESYGSARSPENTEELRADLMEAVLPMLEETYRLRPGRENRAIVGLSMGGLHSLTIGLNELETFSAIGAFSAAVPTEEAVATALGDGEATNTQLDLLWIACGEDDFLLDENHRFRKALKKAGVEHEWHLTEGAHSWPVWRDYLGQFAPRLFQ